MVRLIVLFNVNFKVNLDRGILIIRSALSKPLPDSPHCDQSFILFLNHFNRLDLPGYPTYGHLKEALDYIAKNEIRGFGLDE